MPKLSEKTRAKRREHILVSAWSCFSRNGFHATSMDDVIAATGMSSSAVYRYFRSKEELIEATADEGLALVREIFTGVLAADPLPSPAEVLGVIVGELRRRTENPDYDLSRIALQIWAESLRSPSLHGRAGALYQGVRERLAELARRWRANGQLPESSDPEAVAGTLFALMHGLIVCHHLSTDVTADALTEGLTALGAGLG